MVNLGMKLNPAGQAVYRQAVRDNLRNLLADPALTPAERKAGLLKLEQSGLSLETLEKRRDKLVEILDSRRLAKVFRP
jgi:hypothetical protein